MNEKVIITILFLASLLLSAISLDISIDTAKETEKLTEEVYRRDTVIMRQNRILDRMYEKVESLNDETFKLIRKVIVRN